ncbi:hypothetical protein PWT90_07603 [Aphanocladium album]|nr:hypothetical protein PWT90_07603 [Aphanocladium album]
MAPRGWIAIAASLVTLVTATWPDPPLSGRDFDFTAEFKSDTEGKNKPAPKSDDVVTFSTTKPPAPGDVVQAYPSMYDPAAITLLKPDDEARKAHYVTFFQVSHIPSADSLDNVIYWFPWIETNLTVQDSGLLARSRDTVSVRALGPEIQGSEVRNATLQVWRQTQDLLGYIDSIVHGPVVMPYTFAIAQVFTKTTDKCSYDFKRASVDFKIQNKTGVARCDVNSNGAPIPSVSRGATACLSKATSSGAGGGSGSAGPSATATPSSTSKKNDAAEVVGSPIHGWLAMVAVAVLIL